MYEESGTPVRHRWRRKGEGKVGMEEGGKEKGIRKGKKRAGIEYELWIEDGGRKQVSENKGNEETNTKHNERKIVKVLLSEVNWQEKMKQWVEGRKKKGDKIWKGENQARKRRTGRNKNNLLANRNFLNN